MNRVDKLLIYIKENQIDGFFINSYENRRYFSSFTGSNGYLIITENEKILITDQRYTEQAENQAKDFKIITHGIDQFNTLEKELSKFKKIKFAYESKKINDFLIRNIKKLENTIEWVPTDDVLEKMRAVKSNEEIQNIEKAVEIADESLKELIKLIKPKMTEKEVMAELEYLMRKKGSESPAFNTIVASGKRSSLPHGFPTDKKIEYGDVVVIDFGASYNGYMSDITRTLWIGEPNKDIQKIYDVVFEAQTETIKQIKKNQTCHEVDKISRDIFKNNKIERYSLRGLGHGVGLEIHEYPRVVLDTEEIIKENMVFTVEPGIYIPELGGVRIEDVVHVTNEGCRVLTKSPKKIIID